MNAIELNRVKAVSVGQQLERTARWASCHLLVALLLPLIFSSTLEAQVVGSISGYVRDASGAVIPGANVEAVSIEQQLERRAESDVTGFYRLLAMPPGTYAITTEVDGFETQTQLGVSLSINESLRLDFTMAVGQVTTEVTVESTATLVNTENQTLGALVDERRVLDLPLNGRNVMALAKTLPGVARVVAHARWTQYECQRRALG